MRSFLKRKIKFILGSQFVLKLFCTLLPGRKTIVLGFHDVCEDDSLSTWLRIKKTRFTSLLDQLGTFCHFIFPKELFDTAIRSRRRLNLLMTFDDGFANNWRIAIPIMRERNIPAIIFVSTENIQDGSLFWFDYIVIPIQALGLDRIDLSPVGLGTYFFASSNDEASRWHSIQLLLEEIKRIGNPTDQAVKDIVLWFKTTFEAEICKWKKDFRPLTPVEVSQVAADPLFQIGSHSHGHVILTMLYGDEILTNLSTSKAVIESLTNVSVEAFAYPNGDSNPDIRRKTSKMYQFAYTTISGVVDLKTDHYSIPRILVGAYDDIADVRWKCLSALFKSIPLFKNRYGSI